MDARQIDYFRPASSRARTTALGSLAALVLCLAMNQIGRAEGNTRWLTGKALSRQRRQTVSLNWIGVPIRQGLAEVSRLRNAAILLDRRIDPGRTVELKARQVTLDDLLDQLADKVAGGASWLGPVAYVGPPPAASRLRTLAALRAADLRALPKETRARFLAERAWRWDGLAEPRELLAGLAAEANVELRGLELMPHDLWPAADLPPLRWTDRFTLIANEFDLGYEWIDAATVRLAPIVEPVLIERGYPAGKKGRDLVARWRELAPDAEIKLVRGKVVVRGRLEDHERLKPPKPPPAAESGAAKPGTKVYTLTVHDQPLAAVLATLRASSIEINVDEAALKDAGLSIERRVSFSVERATLEELLAAALKPAGLTFRSRGEAYKIIPDKRSADDR